MLSRSRAVVDIVENKAELLGDRLLIEKPGSDCSNHYSMLQSSAQGSSTGGDAFATIGDAGMPRLCFNRGIVGKIREHRHSGRL